MNFIINFDDFWHKKVGKNVRKLSDQVPIGFMTFQYDINAIAVEGDVILRARSKMSQQQQLMTSRTDLF